MPKTPWRCSQCGTVNEPAANSCRTCGRWPSLFDLQDSAVGEAGPAGDEPDYEVERYEPEAIDETVATPSPRPSHEEPVPRRAGQGARRLVRLVIPIGVLLYFLISSYLSNR